MLNRSISPIPFQVSSGIRFRMLGKLYIIYIHNVVSQRSEADVASSNPTYQRPQFVLCQNPTKKALINIRPETPLLPFSRYLFHTKMYAYIDIA